MAAKKKSVTGTPESPWQLKTPPGSSDFEAWRDNWYGLKKGLRGRFGVYVAPVLEALRSGEVTKQNQ